MSSAWDVAIVGAGPAGAASAIAAARAGLKVVVLDVAQFPRQKVCGEYLAPAAWRLLDELGVDDLYARAVPLPTMHLAADETHCLTMQYDDERSAPRALSRFALDARLVDEARRAGAVILTERRIRGVVVEARRAVAVECSGDAEHEPGERIAARLIIAADGRRSVVVRDTGVLKRRDSGLFGFKRHVRLTNAPPSAVVTMYALPGGYIGTSPTEDGALNVCGVMPRKLLKGVRGDVAAALDAWLVDRPTLRSIVAAEGDGPWLSMPDVSRQTARPLVAGVLYVGDAQGTIDPFTGQGMTMALASARLAARWIQDRGVNGIDELTQQSYSAEWRETFARPIRDAKWFGQLILRPGLLKASMIATGPLPGLKDFLFRRAHRRTLTIGG